MSKYFKSYKPTEDQTGKMNFIRERADNLFYALKNCPANDDKKLAILRLRECVMMANAAIMIPPDGETT